MTLASSSLTDRWRGRDIQTDRAEQRRDRTQSCQQPGQPLIAHSLYASPTTTTTSCMLGRRRRPNGAQLPSAATMVGHVAPVSPITSTRWQWVRLSARRQQDEVAAAAAAGGCGTGDDSDAAKSSFTRGSLTSANSRRSQSRFRGVPCAHRPSSVDLRAPAAG